MSKVDEIERRIYFIFGQKTYLVKIGVTFNIHQRLKALQTGSPDILELMGLIVAPKTFEAALHRILSPFLSHGEWFEHNVGLMQFIKDKTYIPPNYIPHVYLQPHNKEQPRILFALAHLKNNPNAKIQTGRWLHDNVLMPNGATISYRTWNRAKNAIRDGGNDQ